MLLILHFGIKHTTIHLNLIFIGSDGELTVHLQADIICVTSVRVGNTAPPRTLAIRIVDKAVILQFSAKKLSPFFFLFI